MEVWNTMPLDWKILDHIGIQHEEKITIFLISLSFTLASKWLIAILICLLSFDGESTSLARRVVQVV